MDERYKENLDAQLTKCVRPEKNDRESLWVCQQVGDRLLRDLRNGLSSRIFFTSTNCGRRWLRTTFYIKCLPFCYLGEGIVGGGEEGEGPLAGRHLGQVGRRQGRPQGREPWGLDLEIFFLTVSNRSSVDRRSAIVFVVGRG